jgi:hypothetical protein
VSKPPPAARPDQEGVQTAIQSVRGRLCLAHPEALRQFGQGAGGDIPQRLQGDQEDMDPLVALILAYPVAGHGAPVSHMGMERSLTGWNHPVKLVHGKAAEIEHLRRVGLRSAARSFPWWWPPFVEGTGIHKS